MQTEIKIVPIKLKSLREQRDIVRSTSNRPRIFMSPPVLLQKMGSDSRLRLQNRTPALQRIRKLDSPKSIYENLDANLHLIEKANAAMEILEIPKEKAKPNGLVYKRDQSERVLKSGLAYKQFYKSPSPGIGNKNIREVELNFIEESKEKKLSKLEAKNLIDRLQGPRYKK